MVARKSMYRWFIIPAMVILMISCEKSETEKLRSEVTALYNKTTVDIAQKTNNLKKAKDSKSAANAILEVKKITSNFPDQLDAIRSKHIDVQLSNDDIEFFNESKEKLNKALKEFGNTILGIAPEISAAEDFQKALDDYSKTES